MPGIILLIYYSGCVTPHTAVEAHGSLQCVRYPLSIFVVPTARPKKGDCRRFGRPINTCNLSTKRPLKSRILIAICLYRTTSHWVPFVSFWNTGCTCRCYLGKFLRAPGYYNNARNSYILGILLSSFSEFTIINCCNEYYLIKDNLSDVIE